MPIGARLRELRAQVERALDEQNAEQGVDAHTDERILANLHEMLALAPRHPFALEKLVDHYRRTDQPALAEVFAKRLKDASPF
jgi:hypothetical protein